MSENKLVRPSVAGWAIYAGAAICAAAALNDRILVSRMSQNLVWTIGLLAIITLFVVVPIAIAGGMDARRTAAAAACGLIILGLITVFSAFDGVFDRSSQVWTLAALIGFGIALATARYQDAKAS